MTVTTETAWRLKQAGFPQPNPEWGQMWAHEDRRGIVVFVWGEGGDDVELMFEGEDDPTKVEGTQELAFMPTVGGLLAMLPGYYIRQLGVVGFYVSGEFERSAPKGPEEDHFDFSDDPYLGDEIQGEPPAEVLAEIVLRDIEFH